MSYSKVILVGNLTRDVELRYTPNGTAVTDSCVAVNDRVKIGEQWTDSTAFVDVTFWGNTAETLNKYAGKGRKILVEGRIKQDSWEASDGTKRSKLCVTCDKMVLLGEKKETVKSDDETNKDANDTSDDENNESIPF